MRYMLIFLGIKKITPFATFSVTACIGEASKSKNIRKGNNNY